MPDNTENARAIKAAYMRMWEAKNREHRQAYAREYYAKNREAILAATRTSAEAWAKANPEARKEHKRRYREKNRLQLKTAQWRQSLEEMAGRPRPETCEACGGPPDHKKGLHFDHCHTNGHFRGWICRSCNLALGNVQDDPIRLLKLVAYLKRTKEGYANQFTLPGL
jgi:hypothetical protein